MIAWRPFAILLLAAGALRTAANAPEEAKKTFRGGVYSSGTLAKASAPSEFAYTQCTSYGSSASCYAGSSALASAEGDTQAQNVAIDVTKTEELDEFKTNTAALGAWWKSVSVGIDAKYACMCADRSCSCETCHQDKSLLCECTGNGDDDAQCACNSDRTCAVSGQSIEDEVKKQGEGGAAAKQNSELLNANQVLEASEPLKERTKMLAYGWGRWGHGGGHWGHGGGGWGWGHGGGGGWGGWGHGGHGGGWNRWYAQPASCACADKHCLCGFGSFQINP